MNNLLKKVIINIFCILIILISFDMLTYYIDLNRYIKHPSFSDFLSLYKTYYSRKVDKEYLYNKYILGNQEIEYRKVVNQNIKKSPPPILLFGCSYVYGHKIPQDKILSEVLGKYTKRAVYNRAFHGAGPQLMLYQLQSEDFYKIIPQPEYIIYVYISDHLRRLKIPCIPSIKDYMDIYYYYDKHSKSLKLKHYNKYFKLPFIFYFINDKINYNIYNNMDLFKYEILESKKLIDKHWKNTKFVVFLYDKYNTEIQNSIIPELKSNGIIIINRNDITPFDDNDTRYALNETDKHPNEHAWEYIVPKLMQELKKY